MELTILMPCLNEAETLSVCVAKAQDYLISRGIDGEVLVADNGSTDGSREIARWAGARVVEVETKGYGAALAAGIQAAQGDYVIMGDSDDSYDFSSLDPFVERLRDGYDLVMGNRFAGTIKPGAMPPLHRYIGNPVLSFIGRRFFRIPIGDFHCGLRGFRRSSAMALCLQSPGMEFASEMVVKASLAGQRIAEVPTTLSPDGRTRPPHLRSWRDGWRHLRFLLLYSPRWLFFYPGLVLMLAGIGLGGVLTVAPVTFGSISLDVNTLVVCAAAALLGYQSVWFALLSKSFASREGLLPNDVRVERFRQRFPLEVALMAAAFLFFVGAAGLTVATIRWDFNALEPRESLRLVVPSVTLILAGGQTALCSLLLGILSLPSARPPSEIAIVDREPDPEIDLVQTLEPHAGPPES